MASFNVKKFNDMQKDEMLKIYTLEMYQKEIDETDALLSELMEKMDDVEYFKFVRDTEPLATYDYYFGMLTEHFIDDNPVIPVRTIKRVREQVMEKLNSIK